MELLMRLLKVLIPCTLALAVAACGRVETSAQPIPTFSPIAAEAPTVAAPDAPTAAPDATDAAPAAGGPQQVDPAQIVTTPSGLKYVDLQAGTGAEATNGKQLSVHYTGWLQNGTKFDSSLDRGEPLPLKLGDGQVIPGWEEGLTGMKVGGQRQLIIPPNLAYGEQGAGGGAIPPNATLVFEVELVDAQ
ncbi:MAG: FKBP-type peptidyl-prolyl cis-trans isomerase [Chloroflexales bacterium]|nr:FKBP-type peptidyl-prolyl cis-trans isomerase [Chloroflexales bacterium]